MGASYLGNTAITRKTCCGYDQNLPGFVFLPILPQGESSYLEKGSPLGCDIRENGDGR